MTNKHDIRPVDVDDPIAPNCVRVMFEADCDRFDLQAWCMRQVIDGGWDFVSLEERPGDRFVTAVFLPNL